MSLKGKINQNQNGRLIQKKKKETKLTMYLDEDTDKWRRGLFIIEGRGTQLRIIKDRTDNMTQVMKSRGRLKRREKRNRK